jgi:hypothetical protein
MPSVRTPLAAAVQVVFATAQRQRPQVVTFRRDFPERPRDALSANHRESQARAVRGPAQPERATGRRRDLSRFAPVATRHVQLLAAGEDETFPIRRPGGVVGHDRTETKRCAANGGYHPERVFEPSMLPVAHQQPRPVRDMFTRSG